MSTFTNEEITFLLDCFNGVMTDSQGLTPNIWGHLPFYKGPEVPSINGLISKVHHLDKQEFVQQVVCWQDYSKAKAYLESL